MLDNLRRRIKARLSAFAPERLRSSTSIKTQNSPPSETLTTSPKTTIFLDLPPELRNYIYDLVANNTKLCLFDPWHKPKAEPPSLLLVNRRVRSEARLILLSISPVRAIVTDCQFQKLVRLVGSLHYSELEALRANPGLTVELRIRRFLGRNNPTLRQWAIQQDNLCERLSWTYELAKPARMRLAAARKRQMHHKVSLQMLYEFQRWQPECLAADIKPIVELLYVHSCRWHGQIDEVRYNGLLDVAKFVSLSWVSYKECHEFMISPVKG